MNCINKTAKFKNLLLKDVEQLLHSKIHEYRMTAIIILVNQFKKDDEKLREKILFGAGKN
ncbi:DNA alkylation repair protein [Candidatus Parcubacteria bacterium]|nr:DNA alkylation repair protein [Candidatus Parcubacteria bacterium]